MPQLPFEIGFSGTSIASLFFLLCVVLVFVVSLIMLYHWRKYGMGGKTLALTEVVYISVSVILLAVAFFNLN